MEQGQLPKFLDIYLTDYVFSHYKLYIAVSWCRSAETLKFYVVINDDMIPKNRKSDVQKDIIKNLMITIVISMKKIVYEKVLPHNDDYIYWIVVFGIQNS